MTITEARALAAEYHDRVKSIGSSETQHADIARLATAANAIVDLANQLEAANARVKQIVAGDGPPELMIDQGRKGHRSETRKKLATK